MADKPKVYFSRTITPEKVVELYGLLGVELPGKVAIKVHSGEVGNQNFLHPDFWAPMVDQLHGTVVECNTAYDGERNTTEKHLRAIAQHGWNDYFDVDLMDAEGPDLELPIPNGLRLKKNFVGKNLAKYDSMLVLSHFKGSRCPRTSGRPTTTNSSSPWLTPRAPWLTSLPSAAALPTSTS